MDKRQGARHRVHCRAQLPPLPPLRLPPPAVLLPPTPLECWWALSGKCDAVLLASMWLTGHVHQALGLGDGCVQPPSRLVLPLTPWEPLNNANRATSIAPTYMTAAPEVSRLNRAGLISWPAGGRHSGVPQCSRCARRRRRRRRPGGGAKWRRSSFGRSHTPLRRLAIHPRSRHGFRRDAGEAAAAVLASGCRSEALVVAAGMPGG